MTTVPLGIHAYKRTAGNEPEIRLVNRFVEEEPTNSREQTALLSRAGTRFLDEFPGALVGDTVRGLYSKPGLFGDDLFVVVGSLLYRYSEAGDVTPIGAALAGSGRPSLTWDKGLTYERMFISDGVTLSYYEGGSAATGVLTSTVTATNQVLNIGGTYYTWGSSVNAGTPDGSAAHPFICLPQADPLLYMANMLNFIGTPGVDFSTAITAPNTQVTAVATGANSSATGTLTAAATPTTQVVEIGGVYYSWSASVNSGAPDGTSAHPWLCKLTSDPLLSLANTIMLNGTPGLDWSSGLTAANSQVTAAVVGTLTPATQLLVTAILTGPGGASITTSIFSGASLSWGAATLVGGSVISTQITVSSIAKTTAANSIVTSVTGTAGMSWGAATLSGGGLHAVHGIPIPTGEGIGALTNLNHFIMAAVANSQKIFYLRPGSVVMDALDFASKESNPDPVVDMVTAGDFVYVMGSGSTEVWYSTGNADNPLAPVVGRTAARGVLAGTPVNIRDDVLFVGNDGVVYSMVQGPIRISDHAIEERIRTQLRREKGLT
jgi:hypothetical protein